MSEEKQLKNVKRCDLCNRKLTLYDFIDANYNVKVCMSCALADISAFKALVDLVTKVS